MRFRSLAFRQPASLLKTLVTVGVAVLGWAAGSAVVARPAGACSCAEPTWRVHLVAATVNPPGDDHKKLWPLDGSLTYYPGAIRISNDVPVAGVVTVAEAGP